MKKIETTAKGSNFTAVCLGKLSQLGEHGFIHPASGQEVKGKVFIKDATHATGTQISYGIIPPHTELPYFHTHKNNEESYLILSGKGKFQVDDACFDIAEGSIVRVAPAGKRSMVNTSDEPMVYITIQAKENSLHEHTMEDGELVSGTPLWK